MLRINKLEARWATTLLLILIGVACVVEIGSWIWVNVSAYREGKANASPYAWSSVALLAFAVTAIWATIRRRRWGRVATLCVVLFLLVDNFVRFGIAVSGWLDARELGAAELYPLHDLARPVIYLLRWPLLSLATYWVLFRSTAATGFR